MTINNNFKELRQKAEELLKKRGTDHSFNISDIEKLIEELNIRQIELEMQNSELQIAFEKLSNEQHKYRDLYQNAPIAYITLNSNGNIFELNHAAAGMLKMPIHAFYRTSIFPYLENDSKIKFTQFFKRVFKSENVESCDIDFLDSEKNVINTKLSASAYFDVSLQINLCRCAITDITLEKEFERNLRIEKQKLDLIFNNVSEGIIISESRSGFIIYGNKSFCSLFNYHITDIPFIHTDQLYTVDNTLLNTISGSKTREFTEIQCRRSDGSLFYADLHETEINFDGIECHLTTFTDVTSRHNIELARKENEKKLQKVYDILDVGISITDEQGNLIDCNQASEKILGVTKKEHLSRNLSGKEWQIIRPDYTVMPPDEFAGVRAVKENRTVNDVIMGVVKQHGEVTWISVNATPVDLPGFGAIISYIDITESLQAHMALQESEQRLKLYINSTSDIVFTMDVHQRHTGIYGDWPRKSGMSDADFLGKTPKEIFGESAFIHEEANNRAIKGENVVYEWSSCINGALSYYQTSLSPLFDGNEVTGIIGVGRDITELKKYEFQLKELNATKDKLFSIVAHDLRSPFNSLLGFSELLLENLNNYDVQKIEFQLKQINSIARNTFGLLEDLLIWSRSQSQKITFEPQKVSFKAVCNEIAKNLKENAESKKITINILDPDEVVLKAEMNMLKTILRNLVSNAIKFTGKNGHVNVIAEKGKDFATIIVSDNGIGIEKENQRKIWDISHPFTRIGTANEKGTGLGLTLCKEFVEKHGGRIWVSSEVGKGSEFKFTIPLYS